MEVLPYRLALSVAFALAMLARCGLSLAADAGSAPVTVEVTNASEAESCAEKDNVTIYFTAPAVRRFRIEAAHPAYISGVHDERREPDWTDCDIEPAPAPGPPTIDRRVTFYESPFLWVTGYQLSSYWRQRDVPVRIGDRVEHNLTMLQLWVFVRGIAQQVIVLYPTDGIWRIHPLPPVDLPWTSYGASFFVGPIEIKQRPVVEIKEITYDPPSKTFHLVYASGGSGDIKLADLDEDHIVLDVSFDRSIAGQSFAALRSMYVTELNADVARIAVQRPQEKSWLEEPIMNFRSSQASRVWMGRLVPSRHNMSAPNMVFSNFSGVQTAP